MVESREEQDARTPLDSLQDLVADGSQAIVEGVQSIQRVVLATGRGVEGQVSSLLGTLESTLSPALESVLTRFSASLKTEVDRVTEQVHGLEARFGDLPSIEEGLRDLLDDMLDPIRTLATGADERAAASLHRASEVVDRMERVEGRMSALANATRPSSAIEQQMRREIDELQSRIDGVGTRMTEIGRDAAAGRDASGRLAEMDTIRTLASDADERAGASLTQATQVGDRIERLEARVSSLATAARSTPSVEQQLRREIDELGSRLDESGQRIGQIAREAEVGRDLGAKLAELGAVRERLTRIENRVLETSKEQIARAGEATGMRDRVARLEARLTDLSREQVARAVESAGLRERVFRLEQRAGALSPQPAASAPKPSPPLRHEPPLED